MGVYDHLVKQDELDRYRMKVVDTAKEWRKGAAARGIAAKDEPLIAAVDALLECESLSPTE